MKNTLRTAAIGAFLAGAFLDSFDSRPSLVETPVSAQTVPTPAETPFDQAAAIAKLREQIKGREGEPASAVFKNIQTMKNTQAARLLAVMEMGFARALGVNCTHCHIPGKWEAEDKPQKQHRTRYVRHGLKDQPRISGKHQEP